MTIGENIKKTREAAGLTQKELAERLGIKAGTISAFEKDRTNIKNSTLERLADALGCSVSHLLGWDDTANWKPNRIKVYGSVPAGVPIEAVEDVLDWEDIPMDWIATGDKYIGLKVKGDSMSPKYLENDTIIVKLQSDCESGQDAVVYINGYDATLKKVIKQQDGIMLQPINPDYEPKKYDYNDELFPVSILGIVVEIRRKV